MKRLLTALAIVALMGAPAFAKHAPGMMPTCAAGDPVVWVNTKSHVMHMKGDSRYGRTKHGIYACQSEAMARGAHMAGMKKSGAMNGMSDDGMMKKKHHKKMSGSMTPDPMST